MSACSHADNIPQTTTSFGRRGFNTLFQTKVSLKPKKKIQIKKIRQKHKKASDLTKQSDSSQTLRPVVERQTEVETDLICSL